MKKAEKDLLLKDLCARLSYGVVVNYNGLARPLFGIEPTQHFQITLDNALDGEHNGLVYVSLDVVGEEPKPYLRSMSSMTEEEWEKCKKDTGFSLSAGAGEGLFEVYDYIYFNFGNVDLKNLADLIMWLNAHHFDYRGLIEKGLALEAPEGMYKTE